jgi:hypothetical protein
VNEHFDHTDHPEIIEAQTSEYENEDSRNKAMMKPLVKVKQVEDDNKSDRQVWSTSLIILVSRIKLSMQKKGMKSWSWTTVLKSQFVGLLPASKKNLIVDKEIRAVIRRKKDLNRLAVISKSKSPRSIWSLRHYHRQWRLQNYETWHFADNVEWRWARAANPKLWKEYDVIDESLETVPAMVRQKMVTDVLSKWHRDLRLPRHKFEHRIVKEAKKTAKHMHDAIDWLDRKGKDLDVTQDPEDAEWFEKTKCLAQAWQKANMSNE